jgi:hypothetical protein
MVEASRRAEFAQHLLDYLKHITTLSTGAIVLMAAFLEKVFIQPKWRVLVAISLVSFMASIVAALVVHTIVLGNHFESTDKRSRELMVGGYTLIIVWATFVLGMLSLTIFTIRNLWA